MSERCESSGFGGGDRAIGDGIAAAEYWPDFARDAAAVRFEGIAVLAKGLDAPPTMPADIAAVVDRIEGED
jgi:hypothetical protein